MKINSKEELDKAAEEIFQLMDTGERNLSEEENGRIIELGLAVQEYEHRIYPIQPPIIKK